MSYLYAFKNRIDFAGSGLSEVKKSDIDIPVNIAEKFIRHIGELCMKIRSRGSFCNFVADRLA